jgi:VWFA-related protein
VQGAIKTKRLTWTALGIVLCALSTLSFQDKPRESVTVTAVELPVRVFDKSGFVSGLAKEDFEVFENGVKQEITGFEAVSRTISPIQAAAPDAIPQPPRKRNFLLIFNVFDYTDQVGEAIDYFFKNIYRDGDRLIVIIEDKFFNIGTGAVKEIVSELKRTLIEYKIISRREIGKAFYELDRFGAQLATEISRETAAGGSESEDAEMTGDPTHDVIRFYDLYKSAWLEFRQRLLDIDLDVYRSVAKKMDRMEGDKWAICFQQRNLFPQLKSDGRLDRAITQHLERATILEGMIQTKKSEIRSLMDLGQSVQAEKIRALLTEANITFHLLIMKSIASRGSNESRDLELGDVRAEYEDSLRKISQETGGLSVFSNKVVDSLKEAAAREDQYYMLVYQSKGDPSGMERKIEVKSRRAEADIVALKRFIGQKPPTITISGFGVKNKRLEFDVMNAGRIEQGGWNAGKIVVKVSVFDTKSARVFNDSKALDLMADSIHLALNFEKLASGKYFVIVEASDLVTGEKDVLSRTIAF